MDLQKCMDKVGLELFAGFGTNDSAGLLGRKRLAIGARTGQGVVAVRDGDDSRQERDVGPLEAVG